MWRGFSFDLCTRVVSEHLMLWFGEWARGRKHGTASSEAEIRSRGRPTLERGGDSLERASVPRARRRFGGTASGPSREAEICPRGARADRLMGR
jgi:hypothetical protein